MSGHIKTILIPVYDGTITKNLLRTDFLRILKQAPNVRIVLIPPVGKGEAYKKEFSDTNVIVELEEMWKHDRLEWMFSSIFKHSIPTVFMKIRQVDWYRNQQRYVAYAFTSGLRFLGHFKLWRKFLMVLSKIEPIPKDIKRIYTKWNPDLVFAPTMIPRDEVAMMRLARRDGKKVIGMAKSFDNLTSKSYLRVHPDKLIVPNPTGIDEAVTLYDFPRENVVATGICQYDDYFEEGFVEDKKVFYDFVGLDLHKKTIMYAPAGDWMNPNDHVVLGEILKWIDEGVLPETQVLLRLHPAYESKTESLAGHPSLIIERPGEHTAGLGSYEFKKDDVRHLADSLSHSDVVINTASTMMVESCIFDTPVIALGFDGHKKETYWHSTIRYYDREHLVPVVEAKGNRVVTSFNELQSTLLEYFEHPEHDEEGRKKVVESVLYKMDGKSCERTAKVLLDALQ